MKLGNKPKNDEAPVVGRRYWWLAVGRDASPMRYFDGGWRAFEFIILQPYNNITGDSKRAGEAHPYSVRIAFAFWLPFFSI